jgi:uncharacterized damage-inducible protein DinB
MRSAWLLTLFLLAGVCFAQETGNAPETKAPAQAAQSQDERPKSIIESINVTWTDEQKDFTDLADAMPEAKWTFKPSSGEFKDVRTFAEQVKHVACANEGFAKELQGQTPPEGCEKGGPNPAKSKAELMDYLRASFQMLDDQLNGIDEKNQLQPVDGPYGGPNTRLGMAVLAAWHVADHYGQLVEYLRMNGIVPPASRPPATPSK